MKEKFNVNVVPDPRKMIGTKKSLSTRGGFNLDDDDDAVIVEAAPDPDELEGEEERAEAAAVAARREMNKRLAIPATVFDIASLAKVLACYERAVGGYIDAMFCFFSCLRFKDRRFVLRAVSSRTVSSSSSSWSSLSCLVTCGCSARLPTPTTPNTVNFP